jgi:hypothetical protein
MAVSRGGLADAIYGAQATEFMYQILWKWQTSAVAGEIQFEPVRTAAHCRLRQHTQAESYSTERGVCTQSTLDTGRPYSPYSILGLRIAA